MGQIEDAAMLCDIHAFNAEGCMTTGQFSGRQMALLEGQRNAARELAKEIRDLKSKDT